MLKEIEGDLLTLFDNGEFDVIAHGCNCQCTMGSGIAKKIRDRWPIVYQEDCKTEKGNFHKLGLIDGIIVDRSCQTEGIIYNIYSQFRYGNDGELYLNYDALFLGLEKLFFTVDSKYKIGLPKIGCQLAGGDWDIVKSEIKELVNIYNVNVTIVHFKE